MFRRKRQSKFTFDPQKERNLYQETYTYKGKKRSSGFSLRLAGEKKAWRKKKGLLGWMYDQNIKGETHCACWGNPTRCQDCFLPLNFLGREIPRKGGLIEGNGPT